MKSSWSISSSSSSSSPCSGSSDRLDHSPLAAACPVRIDLESRAQSFSGRTTDGPVSSFLLNGALNVAQAVHEPTSEQFPILRLLRLFREVDFCDGCCVDPMQSAMHAELFSHRLAFDWLERQIENKAPFSPPAVSSPSLNGNQQHIVFICSDQRAMDSFTTYLAIPLPDVRARFQSAHWFVCWRNGSMFSAEEIASAKATLTIIIQAYRMPRCPTMAPIIDIEEPMPCPGSCKRDVAIYKAALDSLRHELIILCSQDGSIVEANEAALSLFGSNVRPLTNQRGITWLASILHPDDLENFVLRWQSELENPGGRSHKVRSQEARLMGKEGTVRSYQCELRPVMVGDGGPDVTTLWVFMAEPVVDENRILKMQGEIEQRTHYLAEISHEIRTPLACIIGTTSLFQRETLTSDQADLLDTIKTCSHQLFNLINNVLDFAKLEDNRMLLEWQPLRLDQLLQDVVEIVSAEINLKDLDVVLDVDPDVPAEFDGDQLRLRQVLTNLLGNAVKFTDAHKCVTIRVSGTQQLQFEVIDQGPGIPDQVTQADLFEAFVQLDASVARTYGGSGLGLAISRKIIELMGGQIWFQSKLGQGTKICFTLPNRGKEAEATGPAVTWLEELRRQGKAHCRVHIDVDSPTFYNYLARLLETVDGCQLVDHIESEESHSDVPFLLVTTNADVIETHVCPENLCHDIRGILLARDRPVSTPTGSTASIKGLQLMSQIQKAPVLNELMEQGRLMVIKRPLKPRQLVRAVREMALTHHAVDSESSASATSVEDLAANYPLRILVVDDNAFNQMILTKTLEHMGFQDVSIANDGKEAVEAYEGALGEGNGFNLIFMDMQMPVMDGCEATSVIRRHQQESCKHLPVVHIVALTANAFAADKHLCMQAGMCDFLTKPVNSDSIQAVVRRAWDVISGLPSHDGHYPGCPCTTNCWGPINIS